MAQSLQTLSPEYYQDKYEKKLIKLTQKENLWKRFLLGEKMDKNKFLHTYFMLDKVCPINCDVYNFIWDKIEGNIKESCSTQKQGFYVRQHIIEPQETTKDCNISQTCSKKIEW